MATLRFRIDTVPAEIRTVIDFTKSPSRRYVGELLPDLPTLDRPFEYRSTFESVQMYAVMCALTATVSGEVEIV
jgi:hypothetical protein